MTTADEQLILDAIEQAQHVLAAYVEPGPRDPEGTMAQLLDALARPEVVAAVQRVRAGFGLRTVKKGKKKPPGVSGVICTG
jgi:hypothetical protein